MNPESAQPDDEVRPDTKPTGTPGPTSEPPTPADVESEAAPSRMSRFLRVDRQVILLWVAFLIAIPASRIVSDAFPSGAQLDAIITLGLFLIVIAFGQGFVILTGGIDLSVPAVAASSSYACAYVLDSGASPVVSIIAGLLAAAAIGLVNGVGVSFLRIPAFIMTLAISTIVASVLLGINSGKPANPSPQVLVDLFGKGDKVAGLPITLFFLIGVVAAGFAIQSLTSFGRRVYALGSSERAAKIAGLRVRYSEAAVYVVAALFYGIGGIMLLGFSGNARLETGGEYLLPSIAAVLVGGTAIAGGKGSFIGTVGGALLLTVIAVDISAADFDEGWRQVLYGAIVLTTLILSRIAAGSNLDPGAQSGDAQVPNGLAPAGPDTGGGSSGSEVRPS